ncbi:MAG: biopolymer transporter ExbD [Gammaproteobacteria bacterium]|nr:biopolymer transporter ExbD [Gammaproteobacteria bacterium]MDH3982915.1 biopolymer transporter ExbD [Gammaproteobacteria bacterium]
MARKHHYKRRTKADAHEIDVTTFLNLMVVLVPFLLITAVFSRLTIVELDLPSAASGPNNTPDTFRVEVVVREEGIEISNGSAVIATIPKKEDEFDLETLSDFMVMLKRQYPSHDAASVLMEPQIPYDYLIQVMDVVRSVELPVQGQEAPDVQAAVDADEVVDGQEVVAGQEQMQLYALFSEISVGDAP